MKIDQIEMPFEAVQALSVIEICFETSLLGVYLHGSAVTGGLRPNSDVDVIVVVSQAMTYAERRFLVSELMKISGSYPVDNNGRRPLEVTVFHWADLRTPYYPARSEFVYGEWLREGFEAGEVPEPVSDPELTLLLAQARQEARTMFGPIPSSLLPVIPDADTRRAIEDALPALLCSLEGDERNVLLTLTRMWRTLATGEFVPKDVAAEWAISRLDTDAIALISHARDAYLGTVKDEWRSRGTQVRKIAEGIAEHIMALLPDNS